jgi:hypothetical protein
MLDSPIHNEHGTNGDNDQEMTKRDYVSKETLEENR